MLRALRQLPLSTEFAVVLALAFGFFSLTSVSAVLVHLFPSPADPEVAPFSSTNAYFIVCYELVAFALIAMVLLARGWDLRRINCRPSIALTIAGVVLFALDWVFYGITWQYAAAVFPDAFLVDGRPYDASPVSPTISLTAIIVLSIVNPVFEEVLVVGYVVEALRGRRSAWFAIHLSTAVRLVYHLYQGPVGVLTIVPIGFAFAWLYARFGRLWPLIVAHALLDFVPLMLARGP